MDRHEQLAAWKAVAQKLMGLGVSMSEQANPDASSGEERLVKLWAIALLCRTTNNFAGVHLLLEDNLIVEARTLVRCCYENLFRMSYLVAKGYDALKVWIGEHNASTKKVGNELLAWQRRQVDVLNEADEFDTFMEEVNKRETATSGFAAQADVGGVRDQYITYRMLSADSAHPTMEVLSRHGRIEADDSLTISGASLWSEEDEDIDTWELACLAVIQVYSGADTILKLGREAALQECITEAARLKL